jgi:CD109 antigen
VFDSSQLSRKITVKANSGSNTAFMVTTKRLGMIDISVKAESPLAGDAVKRQLLVKPEGETQYVNDAVFVDLRDTENFESNVTLRIPRKIVEGSVRVEVSAVGKQIAASFFGTNFHL